jgi:hypothetical protein
MGLAELRELRQFREKNTRLKSVVADLTLDEHILTAVAKKALRPARRREKAGPGLSFCLQTPARHAK